MGRSRYPIILALLFAASIARGQMLNSTQFNIGQLPFALTNLNGLFNANQFGVDSVGKMVIAGAAKLTNVTAYTTLNVAAGGMFTLGLDQYTAGTILAHGDGTGDFQIASDTVTIGGALTASSLAGSGSGITALNAGNVSAGTLAAARMPALTGAITTSAGSVATALGSFTGAQLGTAISSGIIPIAKLATGTPDGTKFIRDDGTLAVPSGGASGWATTGNAGLSSANFIGTTDPINLNLKVNNEASARFQTNYSWDIGSNNTVSASSAAYSWAIGYSNFVSGRNDFAIGTNNLVSGTFSGAIGNSNIIAGSDSFVIGTSNVVNGHQCIVLGTGAKITSVPGTYKNILFWSDGSEYGPPSSYVAEFVAGNGVIMPTSTLGSAGGGGLWVGGAPTDGPGAGKILATNNITAQGQFNGNGAGVTNLQVQLATPTVNKTTTYTITSANFGVTCDTTSAGFTISLPATPVDGERHWVKKVSSDGNILTLAGNTHNIDGVSTKTTTVQYAGFRVVYASATTQWFIEP